MDKVFGGTAKDGISLCKSCRHAQNIRGMQHQEETYCNAGQPARRIAFPVFSCSIYDDKRISSLYDMREIAWVIHSRSRGPMGFADDPDSKMVVTVDPPPKYTDQPMQGPATTWGEKSGASSSIMLVDSRRTGEAESYE
jgi:hypothetical protein